MEAAQRRRLVVGGLLAVVLVVAALATAAGLGAFSGLTPAQIAARRAARQRAAEHAALRRAEALVNVRLPAEPGRPAPLPAGRLFRRRSPHVVVGYVPYWTMATLTPDDYADATILCYYGPAVGPGGGLVRKGHGWSDLSRPAFVHFVARAHSAGDRVLLTVSNNTASQIAALLAHPAGDARRLLDEVVPVLAAHHLDGLSIDVEGRDPAERSRFVRFVAAVSSGLRQRQPGDEVVVDTYPQSASSSQDFFDVKALARDVDLLFVMAYDMESQGQASPEAPLASPALGLSDVHAIFTYRKEAPASKVVLGIPFYGVDFTTRSSGPRAEAAASHPPVAVTYAAVAAAGRPARWDPASLTPYTAFQASGRNHETWYDDPVSVALKTALAEVQHLAGTGAWAFGDEGRSSAMLTALDGGAAPVKLPPVSATSTGAAG